MITLESCKGDYSGTEADCIDWLNEYQPALVSVSVAGQSQSLDVGRAWPHALRDAVVDLSDDIDGGEEAWQQYLTLDEIVAVIEQQAAN